MKPCVYGAGDAIYTQGEPADAFYIVEEGQCAVYVKCKDEAERLLVVIKAGDHFGEHALISGEPRENTVRAKTAVKLWSVERALYENIFVSNRSSLVKEALGFYVEKGETDDEESHLLSNAAVVENAEFSTAWYTQMFLGTEHANYLGVAEDVGQFILTVRKEEDSGSYRTILWTKNGTDKMVVPAAEVSQLSPEDTLKYYFGLQAKGKLKKVTTSDIEQDLFKLEEMQTYGRYKFGVLYAKDGQATEEEWFGNKDGSDELNEFLRVLGDKVNLEGWTKYRAGLDVKPSLTTGPHSVYTEFQGYEIMFHVSTLLPHRERDPQQIERKRHLGNDIVMIIFQDSDCRVPFLPEVITSNFNHVWAVVRPVTDEHGERRYRLSVVNKGNVPAYGPQLPKVPLFSIGNDSDFRDFLLAKMINGERSTYNAPAFKSKMRRTVEHLIGEIHDKFKDKVTRSSTLGKGFTPRKAPAEPSSPAHVRSPSSQGNELFASSPSGASSPSTSLFMSLPILHKFPYALSSFDMWGSFGRRFVLATDDGVYMYSHTQAENERLRKILDLKRVIKLRVMQSLGLMFILSGKDHVIQVYALSLLSTDPEPLTSLFDKTYRAEYFHVQTIDEQVLLFLFYKQKCTILCWSESRFVERETIAIPGHTECVSIVLNRLVMGIGSDFYTYDLTKTGGELVCLYKAKTRLVPLKAVHVKGQSLLLCYSTKAIPLNLDGTEAKEMKYEMRWNGLPIAISHMFPYVLAVTSTFCEIRTVINGKLVQTLPIKVNRMLAAGHKTLYLSGDDNSLWLVTIDHDTWKNCTEAAPEYVLVNGNIKDVSAAANAERARDDSVWKMPTIIAPTAQSNPDEKHSEEPVVVTKRYAALAAMLSMELSESQKDMVARANEVHDELQNVKISLNRKDIQGLAQSSSRVATAANQVMDAMHAACVPRTKSLESLVKSFELPVELVVPVTQMNKEYLGLHHVEVLDALDSLSKSIIRMDETLENSMDLIASDSDVMVKRDSFTAGMMAAQDSVSTVKAALTDETYSDSAQNVFYLIKDVCNHFEVLKNAVSEWVNAEVKRITDQLAVGFDKVNTSNQKLIAYSYSVINAPSDRHAVRRLLHLCDVYSDMLEELVFAALKRDKHNPEESTDDLFALESSISHPVPKVQPVTKDVLIWEEPSAWEDPSLVKFDQETSPGKLIVSACTLNKLVEYMTSQQEHDPMFMPTAILTLRTYTTPSKLLNKLIDRFNPPDIKASSLSSSTLLDIRCRVLQTIDFWLSNAFTDFNQQLLEAVNTFIDEISNKKHDNNVPQAWIHTIRDNIVKHSSMMTARQRQVDKDMPKTVFRMYTGRPRAVAAGDDVANDMSGLFKSFMVNPSTTVKEIFSSMFEKLDLEHSTRDSYVIMGIKYDGGNVCVKQIDFNEYVWDSVCLYDRFELRHVNDVPSAVTRDAELVRIISKLMSFSGN